MLARKLLAATALVAIAAPAFAGDINPVINTSTDLANDLRGVAFAADGSIYASGHAGTVNEETRFVLAHFNADGTLDTGFSDDGIAELDIAPGRQEQSLAVATLSDGDVVAAVYAVDEDGGQSIYLVRFDSTGTQRVAPEWGDEAGLVEVVFGWANADNESFPGVEAPPTDTAWDLQVDRTGGEEKLVVFGMGSAASGTNRVDVDRYVVRLNNDGTPDASFNGGVPFTFHSAGALGDNARRGLIEADGSILSAGYTNLGDGLGNHVVLIRLHPDGTIDESFGGFVDPESSATAVGLVATPGVAVFNPFVGDGGFAECYAVAKLSDGSYVTTGYGGATGNGVASSLGYATTQAPDLVSFRVAGTALDTAWGNGGTQAIQSEGHGQPTAEERGRHVIGLPDDRTVHVGRYGGIAAVYVLNADGTPDTTQHGDGIIQLGHPTINSQFFGAALSPDGTRIALTTNANEFGARLVVLEIGE
ncbi:MAG: hypothetical protein KIS96_07025 [Bauldia sp.]|nr:hypothetical protein [Bauldia sp.]